MIKSQVTSFDEINIYAYNKYNLNIQVKLKWFFTMRGFQKCKK